ncbi:DegT/DnrJ/EryC1/StrS family aminotransferase [Alphaproteobacteria bacterium]|nr:DegT/DnrJ/EryC1/StrS family aminotransferase [Alphaproteobacteria bacterium]
MRLKTMNKRKKLAIHGGEKTIKKTIDRYNSIGVEEVEAVKSVVEGGVLSKYLGVWSNDFYGGSKVQEFERKCEKYFEVKHAITVNSWTSGLVAAVGAIGVEPGDEIIVTPWTMCASATAILHWNAIPVFADIESETFCLDIVSVEANITFKTRAIIAVDIFGHSADMDALMSIAKKHNLKVISDTAQAPGSLYHDKYAGTLADIGGYSLNYHKHIHTGEGGILVTNDDTLADRMRLIRNHAEAVVGDKGVTDLNNMIGHNFRLGEIECAIGLEQLKKLKKLLKNRQKVAERLALGLKSLDGLSLPIVKDNCTHGYYVFSLTLDVDRLGVSRELIIKALEAEGVIGLMRGYTNLHMLPMYQNKIAYGSKGFPWTLNEARQDINYAKGICPVAEKLHDKTFMGFLMCLHDLSEEDIDLIVSAFEKVWENLDNL